MAGWEDKLKKVDPYVPGDQPQGGKIIKLNTNENPYPPSPMVAEAVKNMDLNNAMRKYPDPYSGDLIRALSDYYAIGREQFFVGTGSDDVLAIAFQTFFNSDEPILFPDVTYSFYPVWSRLYEIPFREIPVSAEGFQISATDYTQPNGGIVIANPNAPTGIRMSRKEICEILDANPDVIVIVDEAYVDYADESAIPLLVDHDNLVIVRTFSKSRALAGARLGFAIACPTLIHAMNNVAQSINSYTKPTVSYEAGVASLKDETYFRARIEDVLKTRARTVMELKKRSFNVLPSSTNFVFAEPARMSGEQMFEELRSRNIYVRHFKGERIKNFLRITIGTDQEMDALFAVIDEIQ